MGLYRFIRHQVPDFIKRQIKSNCLFMLVNVVILLVCYTLFFGGEWLKILEPYGIYIKLPQRQPYGYPGGYPPPPPGYAGYPPPPGYPAGYPPPPPGYGAPPPGYGAPPPGYGAPPPGYGAPPPPPGQPAQAPEAPAQAAALSHEVPDAVFAPQSQQNDAPPPPPSLSANSPSVNSAEQNVFNSEIHYDQPKMPENDASLGSSQVSSDYDSENTRRGGSFHEIMAQDHDGGDLSSPIDPVNDSKLLISKKILFIVGSMPSDLNERKAWRRKSRELFRKYSLDKDDIKEKQSEAHENKRSGHDIPSKQRAQGMIDYGSAGDNLGGQNQESEEVTSSSSDEYEEDAKIDQQVMNEEEESFEEKANEIADEEVEDSIAENIEEEPDAEAGDDSSDSNDDDDIYSEVSEENKHMLKVWVLHLN